MTKTTTDALRSLIRDVDFDAPVPPGADLSAGEAFVRSMRDKPLRDGTHLRAVAAARKIVEEAEAMVVESIRTALAAGDSWTMIGLALHTSKQNAHRKYAALVGESSPAASPDLAAEAMGGAITRVVNDLHSFIGLHNLSSLGEEVNMTNDNSRHVVPAKDGGWDVVKPGSDRASSHHEKQSDAIDRGRNIIRNAGGGELNIHGRDGEIRAKDTIPHGNDPRSTKG
jgi:hypothetical protein